MINKPPQQPPTPGNLASEPGQGSSYISLTSAADLVKVPYQTLIYASQHERLAVDYRNGDGPFGFRVFVHVANLVGYMITEAAPDRRWEPRSIPVEDITTQDRYQPRCGLDRTHIAEMERHLRQGGGLPPIWVLEIEAGKYHVIDGHHRLAAIHACQSPKVSAIILKGIPAIFGRAIAVQANTRNGKRLSKGDRDRVITDYLLHFPEISDALSAGRISQAFVAKDIGVSEATLSRYLQSEQSRADEIESRLVLKQLHAVFDHLDHNNCDDSDQLMLVLHRVSQAATKLWSRERKRDAEQRIKLQSSAFARAIPVELRKLVFRRGGDRRSASTLKKGFSRAA